MIAAIGVDMVAIDRIEALWRRAGERFLARVFTAAEQRYCLGRARPAPSLAARFAAKEAVMKCLGTGWSGGVGFPHIEVVRGEGGAVGVALHGPAAETATARGLGPILLSLSHTDGMAVAFAVASAGCREPQDP